MKKLVSLLMVALLLQTFVFASGREYKVTEAKVLSEKNITITGNKAEMWHYGGYIGFTSVDLTGINSVIIKGTYNDKNGNSGDTVAVRLDSPTGKILGYVHINKGSIYRLAKKRLERLFHSINHIYTSMPRQSRVIPSLYYVFELRHILI